jgi:predicted Zn-dependent protease
MEPPPFYFPTRQALGAVLLQAGRAKQAEAVYRADLDEWPSNGWSLFGLSQALLAQKKSDEATWTQQGFTRAWARADVRLEASRF